MDFEDKELLNDIAQILNVEKDQQIKAFQRMESLDYDTTRLYSKVDKVKEMQDSILSNLKNSEFSQEQYVEMMDILGKVESEVRSASDYEDLEVLDTSSWDKLHESAVEYAENNDIDISNPYFNLLPPKEMIDFENRIINETGLSRLSKKDYLFAASTGLIAGIVDALFVGKITKEPKDSGILLKSVDKAYENAVKKYAEMISGRKWDDTKSAIRYLEKEFKVGYDASTDADILYSSSNEKIGLTPKNHHALSVAHWPDFIGLIVGVYDQLTDKTTLARGSATIITSNIGNPIEGNPIERIVSAIVNWFGHIMSDISGSSTAVGRGAGLPAPFYDALQFLKVGKITVSNKEMSIGEVSTWLYEQGFDKRMFDAQLIPVLINEVIVRLYMGLKKGQYNNQNDDKYDVYKSDLQTMLFASSAVFGMTDFIDSVIRSGGVSMEKNLLHLNYANLLNLTFRAMQMLRNKIKHRIEHVKRVEKVNQDIQNEWSRIISE